MPTTRATLLPEGARLPLANGPEFNRDGQSHYYLAFDASADEGVDWLVIVPQGLDSALQLVVFFRMFEATSGSVRWEAHLEAITPGDAINTRSSSSFGSSNSAGTAVPGTAGHPATTVIALTNDDSLAPGDTLRIRFKRDADGTTGTDDAIGDAHVLAVELRQV